MSKPSHGGLFLNNDKWTFRPGRKQTNQHIDLTDFKWTCKDLIRTKRLFQGHVKFTIVCTARRSHLMSLFIAHDILKNHHVSAAELESPKEPLLTEHNNLSYNDKRIWDAAYGEEIEGLLNLPCWRSISKPEYNKLHPLIGNAIPTMAISTIKFDANGKPKRAKYHIVALRNLDPHPWSKSDLNSPVMSQTESRILNAIAVHYHCPTKSGDIKQAFVQQSLPPNERYILLPPPPGCTNTPPKTFWLLLHSIYGLKRSARHWYFKFKEILESLGLKACPNAPYIFTGKLSKDSAPIYIRF